MNIGIVGYGYWGPKIARNVLQHKDCELKAVADIDPAKLEYASESLQGVFTTLNAEQLFTSPDIDSVVISSYSSTHYQLTKRALQCGKNVLVEKPLSTTRRESEELLELAQRQGVTLMVDHTYLYSNAVLEIKKLLATESFEKLRVIESNRSNFGFMRSDLNVLYDLATHDVSIITYLLEKLPVSVRATGFKLHGNLEQIAQLYLTYEEGCQASVYCSWVSPHKIRRMNFVSEHNTICFDDLNADNKVEIFENQIYWTAPTDKNGLLDASVHKTSLYIKFDEPLYKMIGDFKNAVVLKSAPRSNMFLATDVIRILEKACESMTLGGKEILI